MEKKRNKKETQLPGLNDPNVRLRSLLDRTNYAISRIRDIELAQYKLRRVQVAVLFSLLTENRGLTIQEIANFDLKNHNAVSNLISRMEKRGLVKREYNPEDEKTYVYITEQGRSLYSKASALSLEMVFSVLSQSEKKQFESMLEKLKKQARYMLGADFVHPFIKYDSPDAEDLEDSDE
jgi:DNA-binding MarR family transcriptional regulator